MKKSQFLIFLLLAGSSFGQVAPKREFRGVWVATVNNIDWPSRPGLSSEQLKKETQQLLDLHARNGMNAIILQVRPAADAFYPSTLEPWSRYLSGTQGKAPQPAFDPLQFWIEECHKRNMELHAWINPFRISQNAEETLSGTHVVHKNPEWMVRYGGKLYFDPGWPPVREFISRVVVDIVSRYDVDAIHFDDYFYPYPTKEDFPDEASWRRFKRGLPASRKADWRRSNIDELIHSLSEKIKKTKAWVKFGISPFGVWRNQDKDRLGSDTRAGVTNYDHLYADVLKWLRKGWIDYCLPQIYWQIGHPLADFSKLIRWWAANAFGRSLYIGHALYRLDGNATVPAWKDPDQLTQQVELTRRLLKVQGSAFFSSSHFDRDLLGFDTDLRKKLYRFPALIPAMPWIDHRAPHPPKNFRQKGNTLFWEAGKSKKETDKAVRFIVYRNPVGKKFDPENPEQILAITRELRFPLPADSSRFPQRYEIRISALDRLHNESKPIRPIIVKL